MNTFKIGNTEFGIGDIRLSVADNLLNLEITGDEAIFDELMEQEDCEWDWAMEPPWLYFHDVPYTGGRLVIDKDFIGENEIALYMMEHYDFIGELNASDGRIEIRGEVEMDGEVFPLEINAEIIVSKNT